MDGIYLKPMCGGDELAVGDTSTKTALALLDGLLAKGLTNNSANCLNVGEIVTADRDRIFAHLYISVYGSKVESTVHCQNCKEPFDLGFSIADLLSHYQLVSAELFEDGTFYLEPGTSFRLPTGEDELMLAGLSATAAEALLMKRCLVKGELVDESEMVQTKMESIAPVLNIDMEANCPECGHSQQVQFDIQSFFLMKLKLEHAGLIREVHSIASNYHWQPETILALPRNLRKEYVALINAETKYDHE